MLDPNELKVLLMTGSDPVTDLVRTALGAAGVRNTQTVHTPKDLSLALTTSRPDALITLVQEAAPNDRGLALIRALRSKNSPNRYLPIIAVSPNLTRGAVTATINAGGHEFVGIPLSGDALWRKLSQSILVGRPFVETKSYFGPCRRRFDDPEYKGVERRNEAGQSAVAAHDAQTRRMDEIMSKRAAAG